MKLSIIVPCYNEESTIKEIIKKINSQKDIEKEIIVIDDCSTDDSFEIIKRFQLKCENIKIISSSKKYKSASECRNIGIKKSIGKYIDEAPTGVLIGVIIAVVALADSTSSN